MEDKEIITPEEIEDDIVGANFERIGNIITQIEMSKQQTALAQIKATSEDNERQYNFALKQTELANSRWNKSFIVGVLVVFVFATLGIYLLVTGEKELGLGFLTNVVTGVFAYLAGSGANK